MGYTPENNPYIPGDPYSYDLKWLVQEVKKKFKTIGLGEVTEDKIADGAVSEAKIADGAITENKLSDMLKLLALKDYVTPEMFGAIGDGITDDTAAVQAAISSGKPVMLTTVYAVLNLTIDKQSVIFGYSAIPSDLRLTGITEADTQKGLKVSGTITVSYDPNAQTFYGNYFRGVLFIGSGNNDPIIMIEGSNHVIFDTCGFYNAAKGISFKKGQYSNVINCNFANFSEAAIDIPGNYIGIRIEHSFFDNNGNGTIPSANYIAGSTAIKAVTAENLRVTDTFIQGFEDGVVTGTTGGSVISGCRFEMFGYAVTLKGKSDVVSHCSFNRYLGENTQPKKKAVVIESTGDHCVVEKCFITSCGIVAIVDYGTASRLDIIKELRLTLPEVSDTTTFTIYTTVGIQCVCYMAIIFQDTINPNSSTTNYWQIRQNSTSGIKYITTPTTKLTIIPYMTDNITSNAITDGDVTIQFFKNNSPAAIPAGSVLTVYIREYLQ